MKKIGVLGAGTWGMALARMLQLSGNDVTVWSALEREIDEFSGDNAGLVVAELELPVIIENGDYNPTIGLCRNICKVLGCTLNDLFWEDK